MNDILDTVGAAMGLDPSAVLGLIAVASIICRCIGIIGRPLFVFLRPFGLKSIRLFLKSI